LGSPCEETPNEHHAKRARAFLSVAETPHKRGTPTASHARIMMRMLEGAAWGAGEWDAEAVGIAALSVGAIY
jgi:hypothetical protein